MSSPTSATMKKLVLVIGESGVGKSTIVNMLYNDDFSKSCCQEPCATSDRAAAVTKALTLHMNLRSGWCMIDTVGIGDRDLTLQEVVSGIRALVQSLICGVHCVVFVVRMQRLTEESRVNLAMLREIFAQRDLKSNSVLVLTHWEGELGEEEQSLKEWLSSDELAEDARVATRERTAAVRLQTMVQGFGSVVLTNNSLQETETYPECREKCLRELRSFIENCQRTVKPRPISWREIVARLLEQFRSLWGWTSELKVDDLLASGAADAYCGDCSICLEPLEVVEAVQIACTHAFHSKCVRSYWIMGGRTCPLCQGPLEQDGVLPFSLD